MALATNHTKGSLVSSGNHADEIALDSSANNYSQTNTDTLFGKKRSRELRKMNRKVSTRKKERECGVKMYGSATQIVCSRVAPNSKRFGVVFCNSTACPSCQFHKQAELVSKVVPALAGAAASGYKIFYFTLTLRHNRFTKPEALLVGFRDCWKDTNNRFRRMFGKGQYEYFWSQDYTWNETNGHHFHLHGFLVVRSTIKPAQLAALPNSVFQGWNDVAVKKGFGECSRDGFDFQLLDAGSNHEAVGRYIVKLTKSAFEVAGHGWKESKSSLNSNQLLEEMCKSEGKDEATFKMLRQAYRAWRKATFSKRSYSKSKHFFDLKDELHDESVLEIPTDSTIEQVPEPLDLQAAEFDAETSDLIDRWQMYSIVRPVWMAMVKLHITEDIQNLLEDGTANATASVMEQIGFGVLATYLKEAEHDYYRGRKDKEHTPISYDLHLLWLEKFRAVYLQRKFGAVPEPERWLGNLN
tara:strand:+ start:937 stop:2340 length:1404 start_codon:yes stop_codon:yes gene_type:complete